MNKTTLIILAAVVAGVVIFKVKKFTDNGGVKAKASYPPTIYKQPSMPPTPNN